MRRIVMTLGVCAGLLDGASLEIVARQQNVLTETERIDGWHLLFDGESLAGWRIRGDSAWRAEDGTLRAGPGSRRGFIVTTEAFRDFDLRLDFWTNSEANSGVFLRSPEVGPIDQTTAVEVNIFDPHRSWPTGSINEVARVRTTPATVGRWNRYEITADGDRFVVRLNGRTTADAVDGRHTGGPIGLQHCCNDDSEVRFRNIKIRPYGR